LSKAGLMLAKQDRQWNRSTNTLEISHEIPSYVCNSLKYIKLPFITNLLTAFQYQKAIHNFINPKLRGNQQPTLIA
jgi:hypothetical protein